MPRVSSYHIGICKFLRGFVDDVERRGGAVGDVPVASISETANFMLGECERLLAYRSRPDDIAGRAVFSPFDMQPDALIYRSNSKQLADNLESNPAQENKIHKVLELNILQSEIKSAAKLKRTAQNIITTKIHEYIALRGDLAAFVDDSPVK